MSSTLTKCQRQEVVERHREPRSDGKRHDPGHEDRADDAEIEGAHPAGKTDPHHRAHERLGRRNGSPVPLATTTVDAAANSAANPRLGVSSVSG